MSTHPMKNDNQEDPPAPRHHWEEYTWTVLRFDNGIIKYDPPTDPTFYIPSSHNDAPDWDLMQSIELIASILEDYREWFTREADDLDLIEEWTPHVDLLTLVSQHMKEILAQRRIDREVKDEARKVCEDHDNDPQSHPTPSPHRDFKNNIRTIVPDIIAPIPFPPSPNISVQQPHPHIHLHPSPLPHHPDILAPLPLPLKPNIHQMHCFMMFEDEHCLKGTRCVIGDFPFHSSTLSLYLFVTLSFPIYLFFDTLPASHMDFLFLLPTL